MKAIQKNITIIIWCCSIAISLLGVFTGFGSKATSYICVTMLSVSSIATILCFVPIGDRIKAVLVLILTGTSTLGVSIMLGGNSGTFITSILVLGIALLYFDPVIIAVYSSIYIAICLIIYFIDPVLLVGRAITPFMGGILLFVYANMSINLYIGTRYGRKYMQAAINDRKDAQEKSEIVAQQTTSAQQNSVLMYQKIEQSYGTVGKLSNEANKANKNMSQLKDAEAATLQLYNELRNEIKDSTEWIEKNYQLIEVLQDNFTVALENVKDSGIYSENAQNSMEEISHAIQHAYMCIEKSSKETEKIAAIIKDINEIAAQTNLLAINASIEAARVSKDSGTGFDIVAEQIRTLSVQSKQAAENINTIVGVLSKVLASTNDKISKGREAIHRGMGNLNHMVTGINKIDIYSNQSQETLKLEVSSFEQIKQEVAKMVMQVEESMETAKKEMKDLEVVVDVISSQTNRTAQVTGHLQGMEQLAEQLTNQFTE